MLKTKVTRTGKIYWDCEKGLEFLSVGDYGKENNIKAEFLGLTKEINGVKHHEVDLHDKWVATISTQKGCPMKCKFCDVPKYGFYGNASEDELAYEIRTILEDHKDIATTNRFNVHFARMGEPTFNFSVIDFARDSLVKLVKEYINAKTIHPVVSTMCPKANSKLEEFLWNWCTCKNVWYKGEAGLQLSINSTDDAQREWQFNGLALPLENISKIMERMPKPVGRKYTLNFAVTKDTILDPERLTKLFNPENFIVKITPIHETKSSIESGFDPTTSYDDYDVYREFERPLVDAGWDVIVFVPSKEEDADRITCGNALISEKENQ